MPNFLTLQEIHYLGMNHVGKFLENEGFEFLGVNSELKKNPQFVVQKPGEPKVFVWVQTKLYPENHLHRNLKLLEKLKKHAREFDAELWFAGVGLANAENIEEALTKDKDYFVKFEGFEKIEL